MLVFDTSLIQIFPGNYARLSALPFGGRLYQWDMRNSLGSFVINQKISQDRWMGLILLLIAVFPANIYLAQNENAQHAIQISETAALIRLPFQALFIGLATGTQRLKLYFVITNRILERFPFCFASR